MANNPTKTQNTAPAVKKALPKMKVQASRTIPDGAHTGTIEDVEFSERGEEGFPYVDVLVKDSESGVVLKAGYACSKVTPETELGRLLRRFGAEVEEGVDTDWSVLRAGTPVAFTTETERKKNGRFAHIILESLKPDPDADV